MTTATSFQIPPPIQAEHEALHAQLRAATRAPGEVGQAALDVARLLHPHFVREEEFALPPLALLAPLARGEVQGLADVLPMTRRLKAELPAMLAEHQQIVGALEKLRRAARGAGLDEHVRFADALILHAQTEEAVLYPAALLVGEVAELRSR
ncbi:hemerythrin domain-containing protein [Ramlibacter sp. MMS24-I3-19]|uniref:hemerythrin domain-containing protein n=1 Tax=Ramlibacter sp. MMS24-I3-19 TaxID=3416606 RepID=UPI003D03515E